MNRSRMTKNNSTNELHKTTVNYIYETPITFPQLMQLVICQIV